MPEDKRPSWEEYFLSIAEYVSTRSTCLRRKVGAVLVRDKRILSTGYNGAPKGVPHCIDLGCMRQELGVPSGERHELCRALHAEMNTIIQAAIYGVSTEKSTLYCTTMPCSLCAKMLINAGVAEIVAKAGYPDELAKKLLDEAGVPYRIIEKEAGSKQEPLDLPQE
ncbi:MAG: cytidine/deoxycytidylate deaminase family protein [Planctomycetes bacterium]|nr:cytidine/deoxycytidylate deaminase family protein [Planctomycetota bacterium]